MSDAQNGNDRLEQALDAVRTGGDPAAVGQALLDARVYVAVHPNEQGEVLPAVVRRDDETEMIAFTSAERAAANRSLAQGAEEIGGRELVDLAVGAGVTRLVLDPGNKRSGFLSRDGLLRLSAQPRPAGDEPFAPAGRWAIPPLKAAVRMAVRGTTALEGAWLADRAGTPTIAVDLAEGAEPSAAVQAIVEALRPFAAENDQVELVLVGDDLRPQLEALGEPLT